MKGFYEAEATYYSLERSCSSLLNNHHSNGPKLVAIHGHLENPRYDPMLAAHRTKHIIRVLSVLNVSLLLRKNSMAAEFS